MQPPLNDPRKLIEDHDEKYLRMVVPATPPHLRKRPGETLPGKILSNRSRAEIEKRFEGHDPGPGVVRQLLNRADLELQYYVLSTARKYPTSKERTSQITKIQRALDRFLKILDEKTHVDIATRVYRYLGEEVAHETAPVHRLDAGYQVVKSLEDAVQYARERSRRYVLKNEPERWLYARLATLWPVRFSWSEKDVVKHKSTTRLPTADVMGSSFVRAVLEYAAADAAKSQRPELHHVVMLWRGKADLDPEDVREALRTFTQQDEKRSRRRRDQSESDEMDRRFGKHR